MTIISSNLIAGTMLNDAAENRKATTDHTPDEATIFTKSRISSAIFYNIQIWDPLG